MRYVLGSSRVKGNSKGVRVKLDRQMRLDRLMHLLDQLVHRVASK